MVLPEPLVLAISKGGKVRVNYVTGMVETWKDGVVVGNLETLQRHQLVVVDNYLVDMNTWRRAEPPAGNDDYEKALAELDIEFPAAKALPDR